MPASGRPVANHATVVTMLDNHERKDPRIPVFVSTMTSSTFEVFHSFVHVEDGLRLHTHDHYEINCVLDGEGEFQVDDKTIQVGPGAVLMVNPGVVHNVVRQTSSRYERIYLHINTRFLASISTANTNLGNCFRTADGKPANHLLQMNTGQLREILSPLLKLPGTGYGEDLLYRNHFITAMIRINEALLQDASPDGRLPEPTFSYPPVVCDALRYIDEHISDDLSLEILAQGCSVNKSYLARVFKKEMDVTVGEFIKRRRLQRSKRLLTQLGSPKLIYRDCGFKSYTHFLRSFQQEFGMTTSEYIAWSQQPSRG